MLGSRHLPLRGTYNLRDLGGYQTVQGQTTIWGRFLRADSLHRLEDGEAERLYEFGLRRVIDLRTPDEIAQAPNPFEAFADVRFSNQPMFDDLSPEALSKTRKEGDDPLLSFYLTAIQTRGAAISAIMEELASEQEGAVLFNCTAGKDRTGIIAALLLGLAEVPQHQIVEDYTLTNTLIPDLVAEFLALSRARGGDTKSYAKLLESPDHTMINTLEQIQTSHGSVADYLGSVGLAQADIDRLRARLLRG